MIFIGFGLVCVWITIWRTVAADAEVIKCVIKVIVSQVRNDYYYYRRLPIQMIIIIFIDWDEQEHSTLRKILMPDGLVLVNLEGLFDVLIQIAGG